MEMDMGVGMERAGKGCRGGERGERRRGWWDGNGMGMGYLIV